MLKRIAFGGLLAATAFTGTANAAIVVNTTFDGAAPTTIVSNPTGPNETYGTFDFGVQDDGSPAFSISLGFNNIFDPAAASATATFTTVDGDRINFTNALINGGGSVTILNQPGGTSGSTVFVFNSPIPNGPGTLTLMGDLVPGGNGRAVVSGNLTLSAVPEPSTWAMFILGFGVLGFAMRRRNAKVTSAKANLHFA